MSDAYYEKIARINLTTGEIKAEPLDLEVAKKFIGGRGLGTKILYDEGVASVDPLSPDNKLVYITGPMTGSNSPSSGRYMVVTKSPLTGMIACANSGGIWGAKLKAGWDALIVEGQAPDWCYLNIVDDKIEILDAREYLGVLSEELDDKLKEKHGADCSVLNIGPAGEKQVLLAAVMNDKDRAAGRSGTGAVMGSKKLKAIVVKATRKQLDVIADVEALKEDGVLFTEDTYRAYASDVFKKRKTVVKALCMHIAHDCNLACRYCFAGEGEYHGRRALMDLETGKKALDFLLKAQAEEGVLTDQSCLKAEEILSPMAELAKITGREHHIFDYYGAKDAERVIIAIGSVTEAAAEAVDYLASQGEKVGVVSVHLYRPFSAKHFLAALPKTVKKIAVLDRTKEPGALGEPLYLDVKAAYYDTADFRRI